MQIKRFAPQLMRRFWPLLLALSPLAYLAGVALMLRLDPNLHVGVRFDRAGVIAEARQFAASRGVDAADWWAFVQAQTNNDRYFYYRLRPAGDAAEARRLAPEVTVGVRLVNPNRREALEATLAPDGRVLGHTHRALAHIEAEEPGEPASRALAENALRERQQAGLAPPDAPALKLDEDRNAGGTNVLRRYSAAWPAAGLPELERNLVITVRGGKVEGERVETRIDPAFARGRLQSNRAALVTFGVIYGLLVVVVLVFGVYRFVQRAMQKEVSYARSFALALVSAGIYIVFLLFTDVATYGNAFALGSGTPLWTANVFASIAYLLGGLILGLAYGSGEGDIREAYPGKLTSLDSLLVGRVASRNVARALLVGFALGGWALLLNMAVLLPWARRADAGAQLTDAVFHMIFGRFPSFLALNSWATFSLLSVIVGILLPLPLLLRRVRSPRLRAPLLVACAWFACLLTGLDTRPWAASLLVAAVYAATMLAAFLVFDLLTAVVALGAPTVVLIICHLLAQPAPSLKQSGALAAAAVAAALFAALYFALRGRQLQEDEVRPLYATNLAERLSLQAEANAAREAQVRLMPPSLPAVPGLALAAACKPAHEVGGDFYDFFEIEPGKIGVFVAEGGGRGLASALDIAFAKGYLMPKIKGLARGRAHGDDSPTEVVRALQAQLARMLPGEERMSFAYAVIDTSDGTLRYARCGDYPLVAVARTARPAAPQAASVTPATRLPKERQLRFRATEGADETFAVTEGMSFLEAGESVILMTDGLARAWERDDKFAADALWREMAKHAAEAGGPLDQTLDKVVGDSARQAGRLGIEDDLTAVVVKVEQVTNQLSAMVADQEEEAQP
jgi:serine phosphatase RsbU (regulator of sigma subunit)